MSLLEMPSPNQPDEQVWLDYLAAKRAGVGIAEAEDRLARTLRRIARAILWTRLQAHEDDACYELADLAVARAFRYMDTFESRSKFTTYFYRLVINTLNRWLYNKKHSPKLFNVTDLDVGNGHREALDAKILIQQLRDGLSPEDQQLLDFKLQGYTDREVSRELGLRAGKRNAGEVYQRWRKLKRQLRERLLESGVKTPQ